MVRGMPSRLRRNGSTCRLENTRWLFRVLWEQTSEKKGFRNQLRVEKLPLKFGIAYTSPPRRGTYGRRWERCPQSEVDCAELLTDDTVGTFSYFLRIIRIR